MTPVFPNSLPVPDGLPLNVAIVYEDVTSGVRARHFTERLAERLGGACDLSTSLWKCEMLGCRSVADDAARDAADADYLIVSLRGDRVPSHTTRRWLKQQLDAQTGRGTALIFLSAASQEQRRVTEATRNFLRSACVTRDVAFFSLVTTPSVARAAEGFRSGEAAAGRDTRDRRQALLSN